MRRPTAGFASKSGSLQATIACEAVYFPAVTSDVPPHLGPGDLDWARSRPFGAMADIGPKLGQHYYWNGGPETLDLIELSTSDVKNLFGCGGERANNNFEKKPSTTAAQESAAIKALASHLKMNPRSLKKQLL